MSKAADDNNTLIFRGPETLSGGPEGVLRDKARSTAEKRAVLARWASDAHAVENAPALRELDDGTVVNVDEILDALRALDHGQETVAAPTRAFRARDRKRTILSGLRIARRHRHDDDDPPPPPAVAAYPIRIRVADALAA